MSYVIIGLHGLANKPPADILDGWWKDALLEGLRLNCGNTEQKVEFTSVYWADVLHDPPDDPATMEQPYTALPDGVRPKTYKEGWWDEVVSSALSAGGTLIDAAKRYVGINQPADRILEAKLNDLHRYYEDGDVRAELRRRLEEKLLKAPETRGKRVMLVAHSMGSIIAYDVLRALGKDNPGYRIDHFVTIGSPLGLPHVKNRIYQENHLVRTPSVVRRWTNFAERRDPVSLDVRLADDYAPNDYGVQVRDDLIINGYVDRQSKPNYHKSYGYLRAPEFSETVRSFL